MTRGHEYTGCLAWMFQLEGSCCSHTDVTWTQSFWSVTTSQWPQKGKRNTEDFVVELKSSLLSSAQLKRECRALSTISICHIAKKLWKELSRARRPWLPTISNWAQANYGLCSFCMNFTNFQLTLCPFIDKQTMFLSLRSFVHSCKCEK